MTPSSGHAAPGTGARAGDPAPRVRATPTEPDAGSAWADDLLVAPLLRHTPRWVHARGPAIAAGRLLCAFVGVVVLTSLPFARQHPPDAPEPPPDFSAWWISAALVVTALLVHLSGRAWERWSTMLYPAGALVALGAAGAAIGHDEGLWSGLIPLTFAYTGLFHQRWASLALLPLAWWAESSGFRDLSVTEVYRLLVHGIAWSFSGVALATLRAHQRVSRARLAALSRIDPLTGLGNRRGLEARLSRLAPGDCVVICDFDRFKDLNDAFGHAAGDEMIALFGSTVSRVLLTDDYAARYGGEEFALVLAQTSPEEALDAVDTLRMAWLARDPAVTFSAGIAAHDGTRDGPATMAAADRALYGAKAAGRDQVRTAD
ncbi:GGDEF domain-containing protein [Cellulomonas soli]|uniref:GGDEF domain-containing protein n=1 Tax=Cellulomonas soli TaxID=931535 RepID=UPI003F87E978